jgi:hypothetical protein
LFHRYLQTNVDNLITIFTLYITNEYANYTMGFMQIKKVYSVEANCTNNKNSNHCITGASIGSMSALSCSNSSFIPCRSAVANTSGTHS